MASAPGKRARPAPAPGLGHTLATLVSLAVLLPSCASVRVGNLVHNGDFELDSQQSPPRGWTMWGAEKYKTAANYTPDATAPHGGRACFRIHHPQGTAGYIVSSPEHAIRPKRGREYTVSFWARADRPGSSTFAFTAYESIRPFADAPSPGRWPIQVGTAWRQYRFEVHEGWDFFADRSRFLMLTFYPTRDGKEERTLWIDDVVVRERPSSREGRLVDATRLAYEPLQHRLKPGEGLEFSVDASRRLHFLPSHYQHHQGQLGYD